MKNKDTNTTAYYRDVATRLEALAAAASASDVRSQLAATAALFKKLAAHADNWNAFLKDRAA